MSTDILPLDAEPKAIERRADALAPDLAALVERVLTDPNADVSKLSALLDVNERILNRNAKAAFDEAFSRMWPELPVIDEKGTILNKDKTTIKSRYAKYEDIQEAVRPVLKQFGFSIRHRTEFPAERPGVIRVVGILSGHGHSETSSFEAPPDKNDYRTAIQDQGSTISYGKRYTTEDLLNIITRGRDNDGQMRIEPVTPPVGYDDWLIDMKSAADNGYKVFAAAWNKSKKEYRDHVNKHDKQAINTLRATAQKAE